MRSKGAVGYVVYLLLTVLLVLMALEFAVRILYPQINYQGNQSSIFVENELHETLRLKPNSSGEFFGKVIHTDEYGYRQMDTPTDYDKSWLFLGDSVTFGVAIEREKIFPQLIQNEFTRTRIWNTAVVGYSTLDYLNVLKDFMRDRDDLEKIIIFFCLNDVYGNLSMSPRVSTKEFVLSFLRSNSKLYLFLKKNLFNRSKAYTLHEQEIYVGQDAETDRYLNAIVRIKSIADHANIELLVVILPYEYQLRVGGLRAPQERLSIFFRDNHIESLDLYEAFTPFPSEDYFLYGDPMHFSDLGHKTVANRMIIELKR